MARTLSCAAILLLAGCLASNSSPPGASTGPRPSAAALSGLYQALASLEAGRTNRLNIVQIGDSHTAGDHFSGRLRELFQDRFGNAGRGMLPPGSPFPYWRPYQVHVVQQGPWEVLSSNRTNYPQVPYGLSGFVLRSRGKNSVIRLTADATFDVAEVSFFQQPAGGHIDVFADGARLGEIATRGQAYRLNHKSFALPRGGSTLELRPSGDGSVDIADWSVYRRDRGVVLSGQGFIGATVGIMDRWDGANVAQQLQELAPALIILAFGTNEGFESPDQLDDYGSILESRINALRAAAPTASIVIVGPPDANRLPDYCGVRGPAREAARCTPLNSSEAADYGRMLSRRDRSLCRWHTPAGIAIVREQQRQVAARTGAFFWDWSTVQGGECGATRWAQEGLGRQDRVHMTESGYAQSADRLFDELMKGYKRR